MNKHFSLQEVKQLDMVEYLEKLGYQPQKIRNNDHWYLSPLRDEKTASFKVNRRLNAWYDFGLGQGGNIIDFGVLYHRCTVADLLQKLPEIFSFHQPQTLTVQQPLPYPQKLKEALEPTIKVIAARPLTNPSLCRYLNDRKIPFEIAKKHCKEVDFELNGKQYFAIGFENKSGGFELRNQHFKGSSSPKDVTLISYSDCKNIAVFEGFFSFLSYQSLQIKYATLTNFVVLNSLSFFEKSRQLMEENQKVQLYLDRDEAGKKHTQTALHWNQKYTDQSHLYKNHKDLNDFLVRKNQQQKQVLKMRQHL